MTELYGLKNCDKCRAASKWLAANGIKHRQIDVREIPLSKSQLLSWQETLGWEALINKRSTTWKNLSESQRSSVSEAKTAIALILEHPTLLKRPVLVTASGVYNGFTEASYNSIFAKA
jgi:Spx/MgsR family transcriptional regulator